MSKKTPSTHQTLFKSEIDWNALENHWTEQYKIDYQIPVSNYKDPNKPY